jgi:hypothetical protein
MTELSKEEMIAETSRLMAELHVAHCESILTEVRHVHKIVTTPPPPKDPCGRPFSDHLRVHVRDEATGVALCRHKCADQLLPVEDFEKLAPKWKCESCRRMLMNLRGEKIPYDRENWLRPSQEDLIRAIYVAGGRQKKRWCRTVELFAETKYSSEYTLRTALRTLQGHKVIEMQNKGKVCRVRLAVDCVVEMDNGKLLVSLAKILDAAKVQ